MRFGTVEILHRHHAILPQKPPFWLGHTLKPSVQRLGVVDFLRGCCAALWFQRAESFSCQLRVKRVLPSPPPWLGQPILPTMQLSPFSRGGNTAYVSFRPAVRDVLKKKKKDRKTHSVRMRRLSSRSAALLSYIHLSADKLRIPSLFFSVASGLPITSNVLL